MNIIEKRELLKTVEATDFQDIYPVSLKRVKSRRFYPKIAKNTVMNDAVRLDTDFVTNEGSMLVNLDNPYIEIMAMSDDHNFDIYFLSPKNKIELDSVLHLIKEPISVKSLVSKGFRRSI